jgi:hypothetical protein
MSFESAVTLRDTVALEKRQFRPMDARWAAWKRDPRLRERYKADYFQPETVAARHMKDFSYSVFMEEAVHRLLYLCRGHDVSVVIVIPPATEEFVSLLRDRYPGGYARFISFAESLEGDGVDVFISETAADIGISEKGLFMDYGHMTGEGAARYTSWLVKRMKESGSI